MDFITDTTEIYPGTIKIINLIKKTFYYLR